MKKLLFVLCALVAASSAVAARPTDVAGFMLRDKVSEVKYPDGTTIKFSPEGKITTYTHENTIDYYEHIDVVVEGNTRTVKLRKDGSIIEKDVFDDQLRLLIRTEDGVRTEYKYKSNDFLPYAAVVTGLESGEQAEVTLEYPKIDERGNFRTIRQISNGKTTESTQEITYYGINYVEKSAAAKGIALLYTAYCWLLLVLLWCTLGGGIYAWYHRTHCGVPCAKAENIMHIAAMLYLPLLLLGLAIEHDFFWAGISHPLGWFVMAVNTIAGLFYAYSLYKITDWKPTLGHLIARGCGVGDCLKTWLFLLSSLSIIYVAVVTAVSIIIIAVVGCVLLYIIFVYVVPGTFPSLGGGFGGSIGGGSSSTQCCANCVHSSGPMHTCTRQGNVDSGDSSQSRNFCSQYVSRN